MIGADFKAPELINAAGEFNVAGLLMHLVFSACHRDERVKRAKYTGRVYKHKPADHVGMSDTVMQPKLGPGVTATKPDVS